jgi:hypothetical protein
MPLSMITLISLFFRLITGKMALISLAENCQSLFFSAVIFITTSSSSAPSMIASTNSATFASIAEYPNGKPITVATLTFEPCTSLPASFTNGGGTHTAANLYWIASAHSFSISARTVVGFRMV